MTRTTRPSLAHGALVLALVLQLAACATQDPGPPPRGSDTSPAATTASSTSDVAAAPAADAQAAIWGDPSIDEAGGLVAFLSEGAGADQPATMAVSSTAADGAEREHGIYALRLRDGKLLAGRLLTDDGSSVEFRFVTPEGTEGTTRLAYDALHPESVAELMLARADEDDAAALMDIAEYAAGEGLFEVARVHYLAAADADPSVRDVAEKRLLDLSAKVAEEELARARGAAETGHDAVARRILRRVEREFAGTQASDDARIAIEEIDARAEAKKLDEARERTLGPIRDLLTDARELTDRGVRTAHVPKRAISSYSGARSKLASARRRLPGATRAAERAGDDVLSAALADLERRIDEQDVDNELQLASAYLDEGDLTRARQAANAVLALERKNREALNVLSQIRAIEEERRRDTYDAWWYRYRRSNGIHPYPRGWYPQRGASWGSIRRGQTFTRAPIGVFRR